MQVNYSARVHITRIVSTAIATPMPHPRGHPHPGRLLARVDSWQLEVAQVPVVGRAQTRVQLTVDSWQAEMLRPYRSCRNESTTYSLDDSRCPPRCFWAVIY